jgi:hypothetical protein
VLLLLLLLLLSLFSVDVDGDVVVVVVVVDAVFRDSVSRCLESNSNSLLSNANAV